MQEDGEPLDVDALLRQLDTLTSKITLAGTLDSAIAARLSSAIGEVNMAVTKAHRSSGATSVISARQQAIEALSEVGVPALPSLISQFHQARFDSDLSPRALASIRRDELRAFRAKSSQRSVLVLPALTTALAPARGLLVLSSWPGWLRIVGSLSARVDNLRLLIVLLNTLGGLVGATTTSNVLRGERDERRRRLESLLRRYGSSVPGIGVKSLDMATAREAIREELELIAGKDRAERGQAAQLLPTLDEERQLFGQVVGISGGPE